MYDNDWQVGQEATYLFGNYKDGRTCVKFQPVPVVITHVMELQVHCVHKHRSRSIKFVPKDRLRPAGYNGSNGETKTETKGTATWRKA